jgi:drug/metabolite transporter (DMT)-like permease
MRRGIFFMLAAMAAFIFNDTCVKLASENLPTGQIIFLRGLIATPLVLLLAWHRGALVRPAVLLHRSLFWRTIGEMSATVLYLGALFHMPIANTNAILQTTPLLVTAAAALFLGERVGVRRWMTIMIGFAGVLLIVRPGFEGFTAWSLAALAGAIAMVLRDLSSRLLPAEIPTLAVTVITTICVMMLGGALCLFADWEPMAVIDFAYLAGAAVFLIAAYIFIIAAMRTGDVSLVSPFRYSIMVWAILIQVIVFGAWPDALTLAGSAVLVATGIYMFARERAIARTAC